MTNVHYLKTTLPWGSIICPKSESFGEFWLFGALHKLCCRSGVEGISKVGPSLMTRAGNGKPQVTFIRLLPAQCPLKIQNLARFRMWKWATCGLLQFNHSLNYLLEFVLKLNLGLFVGWTLRGGGNYEFKIFSQVLQLLCKLEGGKIFQANIVNT